MPLTPWQFERRVWWLWWKLRWARFKAEWFRREA